MGRLGKVLMSQLVRERLEFLRTVRDTDESAARASGMPRMRSLPSTRETSWRRTSSATRRSIPAGRMSFGADFPTESYTSQ